jgi:hypothetical protein
MLENNRHKQMRLHQKPRRSTRLSEEQENQKNVQNVNTVVEGLVQKRSSMRDRAINHKLKIGQERLDHASAKTAMSRAKKEFGRMARR